jgi:predicted ATPase
MLKRLAAKGFKSLVDVDRELPRLAVFAGPNAAGKSNFLDAIQTLARLGTSRTLADALAPPIRGFPAELFTLPAEGLPGLLDQPSASFCLEADLQIGTGGGNGAIERMRYRAGIQIDPDTGTLAVEDEYMTRLSARWEPRNTPRIEASGDQLVLRRAGSGRPAHEPIGANHTKLSDARLSGAPYRYFDLAREEFRLWRTFYLDPGTAMRSAAPPRDVSDIGTRGEHIAPFLYGLKAKQPKKFEAVRRALRSVIPAVGALDVDLDANRGTLDIQIEQDGTTFSSRIVSEGTLRVLALCAIAVTADRGLIAFEEPENGVQPQRLDRIAELLASAADRGGAQIIVTTHSPYFIAAMLEQARRDQTETGLFSVTRDGRSTAIKRLADFGLWESEAIEELLTEPDEYDKVAAVARRGWLDL